MYDEKRGKKLIVVTRSVSFESSGEVVWGGRAAHLRVQIGSSFFNRNCRHRVLELKVWIDLLLLLPHVVETLSGYAATEMRVKLQDSTTGFH